MVFANRQTRQRGAAAIIMAVMLMLIAGGIFAAMTQSTRVNIKAVRKIRAKHEVQQFIQTTTAFLQSFIAEGYLVATRDTTTGPIAMLTPAKYQQMQTDYACADETADVAAETVETLRWKFEPKTNSHNARFIFKICRAMEQDWTLANCDQEDLIKVVVAFPDYYNDVGNRRIFNAKVTVNNRYNDPDSAIIATKKLQLSVDKPVGGKWVNTPLAFDSVTPTGGGYLKHEKYITGAEMTAQFGTWSRIWIGVDGYLGNYTSRAVINTVEMFHPADGTYNGSDDAYVMYHNLGDHKDKWERRVGFPMPSYTIDRGTTSGWQNFSIKGWSHSVTTGTRIWVTHCVQN